MARKPLCLTDWWGTSVRRLRKTLPAERTKWFTGMKKKERRWQRSGRLLSRGRHWTGRWVACNVLWSVAVHYVRYFSLLFTLSAWLQKHRHVVTECRYNLYGAGCFRSFSVLALTLCVYVKHLTVPKNIKALHVTHKASVYLCPVEVGKL